MYLIQVKTIETARRDLKGDRDRPIELNFNRTQANSIELNSWIEFDWVRQSNEIAHTEKKKKSIEPKWTFDFWTRDLSKTGAVYHVYR